MVIQFTLPIKPYSINRYYYSDRQTKTAAARKWEKEGLLLISKHGPKLWELKEAFNANEHGFSITLSAHYPKSHFLNKEGTISARTMDLSNWEKPLIDLLFLPKYRDLGYANLGLDDRYIIELKSSKICSDDWYISVEIELLKFHANDSTDVPASGGADTEKNRS